MAEAGVQETSLVDLLLQKYLNPQKLIRRYENCKRVRNPWDLRWQVIQDQVLPDYRDYVNSNVATTIEPKTSRIKVHTGTISAKINKIVSLLCAKTCDPAIRWLDLRFEEDGFNKTFETREWLNQCREALYRLLAAPKSCFYSTNFPFLMDWFTIGTSCREIILRKDTGEIQFLTISMQDVYVETSGYGDIETVFRKMQLTARQAYSIWGSALSPKMQALGAAEDQNSNEQKYEFFEVVMGNPAINETPTLPYVSCVIDMTNKAIVDVGMHHMNPYIVSRFFVAPGETYGRSYVWNAMPTISAINRLSKRGLEQIDYATNPPILVQDETSVNPNQLIPGGFIQGLDIDGRPTYQAMQYGVNLPLLIEYMAQLNRDLEDALIARDVIPTDTSNMTAAEVNQRDIQAFNRIRPLIVQLETEYLHNMVLRTLKLLEQTGRLPPFPYDDVGIFPEQLPDPIMQLRVTFGGQMARIQRMQEVQDSEMLLQKTVMAAQQDPSVLDRINLDRLIALDAEILGITDGVINSDKVVEEIREARRKQQEAAQQAQLQSVIAENLVKMKEAGIDDAAA